MRQLVSTYTDARAPWCAPKAADGGSTVGRTVCVHREPWMNGHRDVQAKGALACTPPSVPIRASEHCMQNGVPNYLVNHGVCAQQTDGKRSARLAHCLADRETSIERRLPLRWNGTRSNLERQAINASFSPCCAYEGGKQRGYLPCTSACCSRVRPLARAQCGHRGRDRRKSQAIAHTFTLWRRR